jgi:hypothetical protein
VPFEPETVIATLRLWAVVMLLDAGVTATVGVTGGGGGVDDPPPPPQPLETERTQMALIKTNMLDFMAAPEMPVHQAQIARSES